MGEPSAVAADRNAWRRAGASAYGCRGVCGAATRAAPSNAPAGVEVVTGDPGALSSAPNDWNAGDPNTLETVCRLELSCWGLEIWGAVPSLHAPAIRAAEATAHHVRRYADMLRPPVVGCGRECDRQPTPDPPGWAVTRRTRAERPADGLEEKGLRDHAAAEQAPDGVVQRARLTRCDRTHRLREIERQRLAGAVTHAARDGARPVTALHEDLVTRPRRIGEPVHLFQHDVVAEQLVSRADHDLAGLGPDGDDVHRTLEAAGQAAPLADGVAGESAVLAHHLSPDRDERAGGERGRVGGKALLEHGDVVLVRDEADLHRLGLFGGAEAEPPGDRAGLGLCELAHRREHTRDDRAVDPPEEVRLVLARVAPAVQRSVPGDHVVPRRHVGAVQRVGVVEQVAKLGERVAAHAGNWCPAAGVRSEERRVGKECRS